MKYSYDIEALESQVFGEDKDGRTTEGPLKEEEELLKENEEPVEEDEEPIEEEITGPVMMALTLEDGTEMECRVEGVFLEGAKEYIALETGQGEIQIMELGQGEDDEIRLLPVDDEEEQARAVETFIRLFGDAPDALEEPGGDSQDMARTDEDAGMARENEETERE